MNEIIVNASYSIPDSSALDSALKQLNAVREVEKETASVYNPLISASGKEKYDAILEQLKPIISSALNFSKQIKQKVYLNSTYHAHGYSNSFRVVVGYDYTTSQDTVFVGYGYSGDCNFIWNESKMCDKDGILTKWNDYNIIEQLEKDLLGKIKWETERTVNRTKDIKSTFSKMTGNNN